MGMLSDRPLIHTLSPVERINLIKLRRRLRQEEYIRVKRQQYRITLEQKQAQQKLIEQICANADLSRKSRRLNEGQKLLLTNGPHNVGEKSQQPELQVQAPIKKRSNNVFKVDFDYDDIIAEENKKITAKEFPKDTSILQISTSQNKVTAKSGDKGKNTVGSSISSSNSFGKIAPSSGFTFSKKEIPVFNDMDNSIVDNTCKEDDALSKNNNTVNISFGKTPVLEDKVSKPTSLFGSSSPLSNKLSTEQPVKSSTEQPAKSSFFGPKDTDKPSKFSIGKTIEDKTDKSNETSTPISLGFSFGKKPEQETKDKSTSGFSFTASKPTGGLFSFGGDKTESQQSNKPSLFASKQSENADNKPEADNKTSKPSSLFNFSTPKTGNSIENKSTSALFSTAPNEGAADTPGFGFSFGKTSGAEASKSDNTLKANDTSKGKDSKTPAFSFGKATETSKAPAFSFGAPVKDKPEEAKKDKSSASLFNSKPTGFSFGSNDTAKSTKEDKPTGFSFGSNDTAKSTKEDKPTGFSFGSSDTAKTITESKPTGFSFGSNENIKTITENKPTGFLFGKSTDQKETNGFLFGKSSSTQPDNSKSTSLFGTSDSTNKPVAFDFNKSETNGNATKSTGSIFGGSTGSSLFNKRPGESEEPSNKRSASGFSFGGASTPPTSSNTEQPNKRPAAFSFNKDATSSANKPLFSFGQSSTNNQPTPFGSTSQSATNTQPPPFGSTSQSTTNTQPFSFGAGSAATSNANSASSSPAPGATPFGSAKPGLFSNNNTANAPTTGTFNFGTATNLNNAFGSQSASPAPTFDFGKNTNTNGFGFGNNNNTQPNTGFSFGASTGTNTGFNFGAQNNGMNNSNNSSTSSPFGFGGAQNNNNNAFGGNNTTPANNNAATFNFSFGAGGGSKTPDPALIFGNNSSSTPAAGGFNFGNGTPDPAAIFNNGNSTPITPGSNTPGATPPYKRKLLQPRGRLRR